MENIYNNSLSTTNNSDLDNLDDLDGLDCPDYLKSNDLI